MSRGTAASLAAAGLLGLCAPVSAALGAAGAAGSDSLINAGEGSSPLPGVPAVKVEVPSLGGGTTPAAEVGLSENSVTVTSPVAPKVEVPISKAETPTVPAAPSPPLVEQVTTTAGGPGSGGGGSESAAGSGSGGSATGAGTLNTAASHASGASTPRTATRSSASRGSAARKRAPAGGHAAGEATAAGRSRGAPAAAGKAATKRDGAGSLRTSRAKRGSSDPLASIGRSLPLPLPVPDWSKPIILLLLLAVLAFGARWWLATRRARRLERRQDSLLRDIEVMQEALAPEVPARLAGAALSVAYRPAEGPAAGGDFYDVFALAPDRVAVILGDVAGHGHEALRQATLTRYTLRAFLKETGDPRAALALSGHALSEPAVEQLATVAIAIFDSKRATLTYALAGHPPPILLGVPIEDAPIACSSPPLGCEIPTGRRQRTISLPLGARACFFSDGLIEARCSISPPGSRPDLLGRERLAELLAGLPAGAGAEQLLAAVRANAAATPDDMAACLLTSELRGARRATDIEELEVDAKAIDGGHLAAYLHASGLSLGEAERALRAALVQLEVHDTAVLLLDRGGGQTEVGVRAGGERLSGAAEMRRVQSGSIAGGVLR